MTAAVVRVGRSLRDAGPTVALVGAVLVAWELVARFGFSNEAVLPPPTAVVAELFGRAGTFGVHVRSTSSGAFKGWILGNTVAVGVGIVTALVPPLRPWALRVAVAVTSLPIIALGPIFQVTLDGDAPKVALAALSVVLTTLVGTIVGLSAADRRSLELVTTLGGGRWQQLSKVRIRSALPPFFASLKISAPAAVLGAVIGEFLGRVETGLGVALVNAQRNLQTERVWAIAVLATVLAGIGYAAIAGVGRALTPWAPREAGR